MGNLLVYKSSAGSGKTTQLVIEYLNLVIPNPDRYKNILAITFTNKAAEEMKSRIVKVLEGLSREGVGPFSVFAGPLISKGFTSDQIKANSGKVLKNILHDYSNFAVSTIDSLMHRIIRSFSYDLKLSQRFEVLLDQEELIQKSVDIILDSLKPKEQLTHFLIDFVKSRTDESQSWHIERTLYDFAKVLQQDETIDFIPDLKKYSLHDYMKAEKDIRAFTSQFESFLEKKADEAFEKIGDTSPKSFFQGKNGIYSYFKKIKDKKYRGSEGEEALRLKSHASKFIHEGKYCAAKAPAEDKTHIESIAAALIAIQKDIESYVERNSEQYFFFRLLLRNLHGLAVLKEIEQHLSKLKDEKDVIHISEFNRRISRQIQANASVPFIYERIGEKYQHCFVDEFQDTSVLQWHNLLPLVTNGLAGNQPSMLVGDAKQSIYRWRGGEVEQFAILPELFQREKLPDSVGSQNLIKGEYNRKDLNTNYRTSRTIVEFNNNLFDFIKASANARVQRIFESHRQTPFKDDDGLVSATFADGSGEELESNHLASVKKYVEESLEAGYRMRDIAILVRTKNKGMKVASFLSGLNYPVISSDSLLLASSPKLHFLMALFRLIVNPADEVAWLEARSFLYYYRRERQYFHDFLSKEDGTYKAGRGTEFLKKFLYPDSGNWENYSLYDLAEKLIRTFELNSKHDPFITFFLDEVHRQSQEGETGVQDFTDWWEINKSKKSIVAPEGIDAIKVYTVHKSKGLEFPVVIVPFISKRPVSPTNDNLWLEGKHHYPQSAVVPAAYLPTNKALESTVYAGDFREEEEKSLLDEINVLYVALTRPEDRLYLSLDLPSRNSRSVSMASLVSEFFISEGKDVQLGETISQKGANSKRVIAPEPELQVDVHEGLVSESWRKKIVIASQTDELEDVALGRLEGRYWGEMMHSTLARIEKSSDLDEVISRLRSEALLSSKQIDQLESTLAEVLAHPELKKMFSGEGTVYTEHDLVTSQGEILRPDRVVVKSNRASLVEYKTGQKKKEHIDQVQKYADILEDTGLEIESKLLVYLDDSPEVVELD